MNKKVVVLLLAGLFIITSVFATQTRMSGLGNPYGLIEDDTDVFTYPATIFNYSGVVVGELQQLDASEEDISVNWAMSANIPILEYKLGVYLNQDTEIDLSDWGSDLDVSKSVEFNFGFMDKFAIGFGTSVDYQAEDEYPVPNDTLTSSFKNEPTANFYSFFGGYSANNMDFGFRVKMANAEDVVNNEHFEMSNTAFELNGRQILKPSNNLEIIVKAGFSMDMTEFNYEDNQGDKLQDTNSTETTLDLGFGLQVKANDNNKIIFGVTPFIYNPSSFEVTNYTNSTSSKAENEVNALFFPEYNLAVESKICSWLTGRMGANQTYAHVTDKMNYNSDTMEDTEDTYYHKDYYMNLGLTFSFGNFCVDSLLQQELLFDGPNFLGGKSNGLASDISVKYKF
jgi:hypothetical protein